MIQRPAPDPDGVTWRSFSLLHDGRPFHCIRGMAHRWGLTDRPFAVVIGGVHIDHGHWAEERCKRCVDRREAWALS